ncbi:MAG: hypothetical protein ACKOCN_04945 [Planctomycetaceae bacterium]
MSFVGRFAAHTLATLRFAPRRPAVILSIAVACLLSVLSVVGLGGAIDRVGQDWEGVLLAATLCVAALTAVGDTTESRAFFSNCRDCIRGWLPIAAFVATCPLVLAACNGSAAAMGTPGFLLVIHANGMLDAATISLSKAMLAVTPAIVTVLFCVMCRRLGVSSADAISAALVPPAAAVTAAAIMPNLMVAGMTWVSVMLVVLGLAIGFPATLPLARIAPASPWLGALPPQGGFRRVLAQTAMVASLVSMAGWLVHEPFRPEIHALAGGFVLVGLSVPMVTIGTGRSGATSWRRLTDVRSQLRLRSSTTRIAHRVIGGYAAIAIWPLVVAWMIAPVGETRGVGQWSLLGCLLLSAGLCIAWTLLDHRLGDAEAGQAVILLVLAVVGFLAASRSGSIIFGSPHVLDRQISMLSDWEGDARLPPSQPGPLSR